MNSSLRNFLNLSRWFAAFLVVIHHVRHLLVVDFQYAAHTTLLDKGLYFVTGFGHEAVVVFFVISGFLVGGITLERWRARGAQLQPYASARISRIYTVLIPALLIGLGLDLIGLRWFNTSELYTNSVQYNTISLNHAIDATMTVPDLLGNLFMLQGIVTPTLGSNAPLWSLAYEWWYYCVFALLAAAVTGSGRRRVAYGLLGVAILLWLPVRIPLWGTIWVLGMLTYVWIKSARWRPSAPLGMALLIVALCVSRVGHNVDPDNNPETLLAGFGRDLAMGLVFCLALASSTRIKLAFPGPAWHERLADFSYTTYLLHFPAMIFAVAFGSQVWRLPFQLQPGAAAWAYLFGLTAVLYLFCFGVFWLTERHTPAVKARLDAWLGGWSARRRGGDSIQPFVATESDKSR